MNYKLLGKILGKIMILESILMVAPLIVSIIYKEYSKNTLIASTIVDGKIINYYGGFKYILAFAIPIIVLLTIGILLQFFKPKRSSLYQKEGFALVALVWIVMALFGAIPFVVNGNIPNYIDACFEIMSGFTTTGASIIDKISLMSHSTLFWRSFSHWIGGMGILVFVLIFIPESGDGSAMHLLRAESPGPQVGKIVSKMRATARILYLLYLSLTVLEVIILCCGPLIQYDNPAIIGTVSKSDKFFHALLTAFGSAGTGGFGFIPNSMEYFTPFAQYTISIFLLLFGCNFTLYFLMLIGKIKDIFRSEELKCYGLIVFTAVSLIFISILQKLQSFGYTAEEAFRHSLFQVASIVTTTGYTTADFNLWPMLSKMVLLLLMFTGAMAGSTAGGLKLSRIVIAFKGFYIKIRKLINPRYVPKAKFEGKTLDDKITNDVFAFIALYFFIILGVTFLLSFDTSVSSEHGFFSNFSAAIACISNIGPGFEAVGPYASFSDFNSFSKIILTFTMLIGRLEILPVLILFSPRTWKKI